MSGDSITPIRKRCRCGHDICSHFDKRDSCLCLGCNCKAYRNEYEEQTPVAPRISTWPVPPPRWPW